MKRTLASLSVLASIVLLCGPVTAKAEDLKIWPDSLRADGLPVNGETATVLASHSPDKIFVYSAADPKTTWYGWAPVNLPVGTVIKNVIYYHGGGTGGFSSCMLTRAKAGTTPVSVASGSSNSSDAEQVTLVINKPNMMKIKAGYTYFVRVFVAEGVSVRGVKVIY
jgi:hypothetical protein